VQSLHDRALDSASMLPAAPSARIAVSARTLVQRLGDVLVPGWATPLAFASVALLLVQMFDHRYMRGSIPWTLIVSGSLAILFASLYTALTYGDQKLAPVRRRLVTIALLAGLAMNTLIHIVLVMPHLADTERYSIDAAAATDCATQQFLHGHDPYTNVHMLTCLNEHGLAFNQTTPKRAGAFWRFSTFPTADSTASGVGAAHFENLMWDRYRKDLALEKKNPTYAAPEFETRFNYPGGAILIGVIAWTFGVRDLVGLFLASILIASWLIYRRADPRIRLVTALLLLGDTPLLLDSAVGATDVLYALILVMYWQVRERPIAAGLLLGLAAATRQQAWFFLPYFLYLGWRTGGWRDLWRRALPAIATFVACNLPFFVLNPGDWLAGVTGPMTDPLFAQGVGLIALSIAFLKQQIGPPLLYALLEIAGIALAFRLFMARCMTAPGLAMLLPLLPIALAWRSLHTYFLILPLLATAVLTSAAPEAMQEKGRAARSR
jgi:hypothetical protein